MRSRLYTRRRETRRRRPLMVRQRKGPAGWGSLDEADRETRGLLQAGEREDLRDVVARLAVRRNAVELLRPRPRRRCRRRARARRRRTGRSATFRCLMPASMLAAGRRGSGRCIPARSTASAASGPSPPWATAPAACSSIRPGSAPGPAAGRRRAPRTAAAMTRRTACRAAAPPGVWTRRSAPPSTAGAGSGYGTSSRTIFSISDLSQVTSPPARSVRTTESPSPGGL